MVDNVFMNERVALPEVLDISTVQLWHETLVFVAIIAII